MKKITMLVLLSGFVSQAFFAGASYADDCDFKDASCFQINVHRLMPDGTKEAGGVIYINGAAFSAEGPSPGSTPTHLEGQTRYGLSVHANGVVYVYDSVAKADALEIGSLSQASVGKYEGMWRFYTSPDVSTRDLAPFTVDYWTCVDGRWMSMEARITQTEFSKGAAKQVLEARRYGQGMGKGIPPVGEKCGS